MIIWQSVYEGCDPLTGDAQIVEIPRDYMAECLRGGDPLTGDTEIVEIPRDHMAECL